MTGPEIAATFAAALGVRAVYCSTPPWLFRKFPFPAALDLGNMMQWMRDCPNFAESRDVSATRIMVPDYTDLKTYFRENHALFLPPKTGALPTKTLALKPEIKDEKICG